MESTQDQEEIQSTINDQPEEVNSDQAIGQSQQYSVNGQELSGEQLLENYKNLQGQFTKKTQELSETKKEATLSDEDKAAIDFIKQNGFVTKADLDNMSTRQAQDANLRDIIALNPDLKPFETAIKKLGQNENLAYEDVIQNYGFKAKDKLAKARGQGDIKGMPEPKNKSISDMNTAEYAKYKAKMGWTESRGSFS